MANNHYDAIVVGSGISGGWAAKELTQKGLKVLMLERGRNIEHVTDYQNADKEAWDYPHRNRATQEMKAKYPVLSRDYLLEEATLGMWADEQETPYVEEKRFDWFRGYHVGGRSLLWGPRARPSSSGVPPVTPSVRALKTGSARSLTGLSAARRAACRTILTRLR
ncbi:choline dehydrogenase-like flavoprotein [Rhizobium sp. RAS22]|nr:choline dehydrogenase-like flavoprotein [Rhizobium sp. RAS22]